MSQYQQTPYQTTVNQPVVVQPVLPVVVPVVSGHRENTNFCGPAHIQNGAKCGPCNVPGQLICCCSIYGFMMTSLSIMFLFLFGAEFPLSISFGTLGGIGAPFLICACYLCISAKIKYDKERSQENTAPSSEPFVNTDTHVYVPVNPGAPPQNQYPVQSSGASYYPVNTSLQPGGTHYPGPPDHKVPEKSYAPEYDQQPSYAPPRYTP